MLEQLAMDSGEREVLQRLFARAPSFMALLEGSDYRFTVANQAFQDLVGKNELVGKPLAEALPELTKQGLVELLDETTRSGWPFVGQAMSICVASPGETPEEILWPCTNMVAREVLSVPCLLHFQKGAHVGAI